MLISDSPNCVKNLKSYSTSQFVSFEDFQTVINVNLQMTTFTLFLARWEHFLRYFVAGYRIIFSDFEVINCMMTFDSQISFISRSRSWMGEITGSHWMVSRYWMTFWHRRRYILRLKNRLWLSFRGENKCGQSGAAGLILSSSAREVKRRF